MGFYLLDRPNPYGPNYYTTRNNRLLAVVVHITAGADDLDALDDLSAENVSHYAAITDRDVSWHSGSDADSWVFLLPAGYTAWHASNYNSCTYGHEISKRTTDWRNVPANWIDKTLRMAALGPDGKSGLRKVALDNGIPLRWATKAELDHARATGGGPVGFITHHEVQSADRTDPGYVYEGGRLIDTFPRARFMALLNGTEEDDVSADDVTVGLFNTRVDGRNVYDWMKQLRAEQGVWGSKLLDAVLSRDDVDEAAIVAGVVAALPTQLSRFSDEELRRIAEASADELDARARDNDPTTGPVS